MEKTLIDTSAEYITTRLNAQARWAQTVEIFKKAQVVENNRVNTELVRLNDALARLTAQPPFATAELVNQLDDLVDDLTAARDTEMQARQVVKELKESLDLATVFALSGANGKVDGKNDEARKTNRALYLAEHDEVKLARAALNAAEMRLEQAQVDLKCVDDEFSACRAIANLMAAQMTYMSGK